MRLCGPAEWVTTGSKTDVAMPDRPDKVVRATGLLARAGLGTRSPDGTLRRPIDLRRLKRMGWRATIGHEEGIQGANVWFPEQENSAPGWWDPAQGMPPRKCPVARLVMSSHARIQRHVADERLGLIVDRKAALQGAEGRERAGYGILEVQLPLEHKAEVH